MPRNAEQKIRLLVLYGVLRKETDNRMKEKKLKIVYCLYRVSTKGQVDHDDIPMLTEKYHK